MSENDNLDIVREKMLSLLEAGKYHVERANWKPGSVLNPDPDVGMSFTRKTCWHFIEQLLRDRHRIEVITLDTPPGAKGYVMKFKTKENPDIYIKLQISRGQDKLLGRSFHYSKYSSK